LSAVPPAVPDFDFQPERLTGGFQERVDVAGRQRQRGLDLLAYGGEFAGQGQDGADFDQTGSMVCGRLFRVNGRAESQSRDKEEDRQYGTDEHPSHLLVQSAFSFRNWMR
jgi:hypothetical protein